jgi:hypothetical protein
VKLLNKLLTLALAGGMIPGAAWAAGNTVLVDMSAAVASSAQLTISPLTINFPDADPDTTPRINAMENPVTVTAHAQTGQKKQVILTVMAQSDLMSGADTIPISNVSWTATGNGFTSGTLSKGAAVTAGSWNGSGMRRGTFAYTMVNSWNYPRGNYRANVVYTLTTP